MNNSPLIRTATESDQESIDSFLNNAAAVHRHLDWRSPLDWLGNNNFLLSIENQQLRGILICTAEPDEVHWIRIFASHDFSAMESRWQSLFNEFLVRASLQAEPITVAAIAYYEWMRELLELNQWLVHQRVVQLKWADNRLGKLEKKWPEELTIRPMSYKDLREVTRIDRECFPFVWTQSQDVITRAFDQSSHTTVAMLHGEIVGFQISTSYRSVAHLARLAVARKHQGQYIGQALVHHMLKHFSKPWIREITVNTQQDNQVSLNLYKKMGFIPTGEMYPIYLYQK